MQKTNRRAALKGGLFGCALLLGGCGGGAGPTSTVAEQEAGIESRRRWRAKGPRAPAPAPAPEPAPAPAPEPAPAPAPEPAPAPAPEPAPAPAPEPAPAPAPAPAPEPAPAPAPAPAPTWQVEPAPSLVAGSGQTFDLAQTLPAGVVRGGVFVVDPGGSQLPPGMTLSSSGILSVGTASVGTVSGVLFGYTQPGS